MANYIISGGPGAGKTTLTNALQAAGFRTSGEVSRPLIQELVEAQSPCLPWTDLACFAELALQRMIMAHQQAGLHRGITFFDRGIPDIIAYLQVGGLPVADPFYRALQQFPYQPVVFMAPPWEAIYVNDSERWQTFTEATAIYRALTATYQATGFDIIELPRLPVRERVAFVQAAVEQPHPPMPPGKPTVGNS